MVSQSRRSVVRYEVQLNCKGESERIEIIDAYDDADAHAKAKMWARSLGEPLEEAWLIVKNADGRFKTFGSSEF